jgi:pimeloyl-ACP methyl ester carboxylesterase
MSRETLDGVVVSTAAGPVEVAVTGTGPAVVLLHGTPGSWRQLVPVAERLATEQTVLLPSRPGYGRTPLGARRTVGEQAGLVASLLDTRSVETATVIGVSGGAPSAAAFAALHPERCRALVLCCPLAPVLFRVPKGARVATLPGVAELLTAAARRRRRRQLEDPAALELLIQRELSVTEQSRLDDEMRAAVVAFFRSHLDAPPGLAGFRNDVNQIRSVPALVAPVIAPTLILHGDADVVVPVSHAQAWATAIPGATLEILPGAGHGFLLTGMADVLPRLTDFLRAG